ncbi:hypothetical protein GWK47_024232 [Chionoecetes opilio]|uniref:Uncharacterized protein n=1 Tax=Chionoecetes opilio TaxID=41210 RepID=A0A8J4XLX8_CHIOP|nr:hypothetical protein GWK47_024232 [Chionoecetes opilio]
MNNVMTQWVDHETRFRREDTPTRLGLLFTKETGIINNLEYLCPFGKSDHVWKNVERVSQWNERGKGSNARPQNGTCVGEDKSGQRQVTFGPLILVPDRGVA